jgi:Ribonuclease G/E
MLTRGKIAGLKEANNREEHCEGKRHKRSDEEWSFHILKAFKSTLMREYCPSGKKTSLTSFPAP